MAQLMQPRKGPPKKAAAVIVISLRRTPERTQRALDRLSKPWLDIHVMPASDGSDSEAAASFPRDPRCTKLNHIMQPGEVGCCMSWWRAAAMIVRNDWPMAVVFEDDATPIAPIERAFEAIQELPKDFDLALLHTQGKPEPTVAPSGHTKSFRRVFNSSWTTVAVCVSNAGARALLRSLPPFDRPVDVWIRDNPEGLSVYQPHAGGGWFRQDQWTPSTVRDNANAGTIPRLIHRIWVGGKPIPDEFERYWRRWGELHPGWKRKTWDDEAIAAVWPNHPAIARCGSPAAKSDMVRLLILQKFGGLYVDTDFEPFKPFDRIVDSASAVIANLMPDDPCNGLMAAIPGHRLIEHMVNTAVGNILSGKGTILQQAGPAMVKEVLAEWLPSWPKPLYEGEMVVANALGDTGITIIEPWVLFPYYWHDEKPASYGDAWAAHHWARSWWTEVEWAGFREQQRKKRERAA